MSTIYTNDICSYHVAAQNIVVVELLPHANITLEAVKQTYEKAYELVAEVDFYVIVDTCQHNTWSIPSEVFSYLANNEYNTRMQAFAFIVNSLPMRLLASHYIKSYKPKIPTKVFTSRQKAQNWVLHHKN